MIQFNTLRQWQNGQNFADIFLYISLTENICILNEVSLNFVPIVNESKLVLLKKKEIGLEKLDTFYGEMAEKTVV